eukprot:tig00000863_g4997.t1
MLIAVEGCAHGDLERIYASIEHIERTQSVKIDLLLCCGDFQAVRNEDDLTCLACPAKYRSMNSFYKYYSGELRAPVPTIFIGGNHEASNHMWELYYGGWVCPNIYFLGYAGVVRFGGLRIAGLSGIFKENHYRLGHFERAPYGEGEMRSAYHVRELEVFRLKQLTGPVDVFLSHDWPRGIAHFGDTAGLLRRKPFLRSEVEDGSLGSAPATELLQALQPRWWFSAHLHVKFAAAAPAPAPSPPAPPAAPGERAGRQVVDVGEARGPLAVEYDPEWLAVLRSTHALISLSRAPARLPRPGPPARPPRLPPTPDEVEAVAARLAALPGPSDAPAEGPAPPSWTRCCGCSSCRTSSPRTSPPASRAPAAPPRPTSSRAPGPTPMPAAGRLVAGAERGEAAAAGGAGAPAEELQRALLEDDYGAVDAPPPAEGPPGDPSDDDDVRSDGEGGGEGEGGPEHAGGPPGPAPTASALSDPNEIDI